MQYINLRTGQVVPAHIIGTDEEGRKIYQRVDGYEPTLSYETDEDGNWVEATDWQIDRNPFEPTHRIIYGDEIILVHLYDEEGDGDGPAYTREEWDTCTNADWAVVDGVWMFQGQVPAFAGGYRVERLRDGN